MLVLIDFLTAMQQLAILPLPMAILPHVQLTVGQDGQCHIFIS